MAVESFHSNFDVSSQTKQDAKVLVVDDNVHLLSVMYEVLHHAGFEVIAAEGGDEALEALSRKAPDVIICDVMMPGIDGFTLQSIVLENQEWCQIPFIFLSALTDAEDVRRALARGCDDYITKPFNPPDLLAVISGKLEQSRQRARMERAKLELHHRRIIHTLSHEFRTPLVSINTGTELLLESENEIHPETQAKLLFSIYRGGQRLQRLVDDFMLLQQIDSGHAERVCLQMRKPMPVTPIVEAGISCFTEAYQEWETLPEIQLQDNVGNASCDINVYDIHVISIIQRLLSNACKFGGNSNPVTVSVCQIHDNVVISVRDRGSGLNGAKPETAVSLFTQIGRDKYEQQGCGLGLTISEYFSKLNGGTLSFHEPETGGLEVQVSFPVVVASQRVKHE